MTKTLLWLDDVRNPLENDWLVFSPIGKDVDVTWVTSYQEFVDHIMSNGLPDAICFDHDLGIPFQIKTRLLGKSKRESRRLAKDILTGYDCAKWLIDYCTKTNNNLPEWAIQSANPIGKENIKNLLLDFKK